MVDSRFGYLADRGRPGRAWTPEIAPIETVIDRASTAPKSPIFEVGGCLRLDRGNADLVSAAQKLCTNDLALGTPQSRSSLAAMTPDR